MICHSDRPYGSPILFWCIVLSSPEERVEGPVLAKGWMQCTLHTEPEVGLRVGSAEKNGGWGSCFSSGERKWLHNLVQQPPKGSVLWCFLGSSFRVL